MRLSWTIRKKLIRLAEWATLARSRNWFSSWLPNALPGSQERPTQLMAAGRKRAHVKAPFANDTGTFLLSRRQTVDSSITDTDILCPHLAETLQSRTQNKESINKVREIC